MSKFQFRTNILQLDFDKKTFSIDPMTAVDAIKNIEDKSQQIQESMTDKNISSKAVENACVALLNAIDELLGDGAHKEIFTGRKVSFYDCLDVVNFILTEIAAFHKAKAAQYKKK